MCQWTGLALLRVMACCLFGDKLLRETWWLIVIWTLKNKPVKFESKWKTFNENGCENVVCEMAAISSRVRWVNKDACNYKCVLKWVPMGTLWFLVHLCPFENYLIAMNYIDLITADIKASWLNENYISHSAHTSTVLYMHVFLHVWQDKSMVPSSSLKLQLGYSWLIE